MHPPLNESKHLESVTLQSQLYFCKSVNHQWILHFLSLNETIKISNAKIKKQKSQINYQLTIAGNIDSSLVIQ